MVYLLKDCYTAFYLPWLKKQINEYIIYYNFSFLIEKSFFETFQV